MTPVNVAWIHFITYCVNLCMCFFARLFPSPMPADSSVTAAFSCRVRAGEPVSRRCRLSDHKTDHGHCISVPSYRFAKCLAGEADVDGDDRRRGIRNAVWKRARKMPVWLMCNLQMSWSRSCVPSVWDNEPFITHHPAWQISFIMMYARWLFFLSAMPYTLLFSSTVFNAL